MKERDHRADQVRFERQPQPDLGNGTYRNPILAGKYPDPSIVRVNADYYMTHSSRGTPGLLIWHSQDMVNWQPFDKGFEVSGYHHNILGGFSSLMVGLAVREM